MTMRSFFSAFALFLLSTTVLMMEVISSRYAKIAFIHDFQFIILSFAIWGLGLGGIVGFFVIRSFSTKRDALIPALALGYAISSLLPFVVLSQLPIGSLFFARVLFFSSNLLFYLFAGTILSLLFAESSEKIPGLYGISLIGSAFGAVITALSLDTFGNSYTVYAIFLLSSLAAVCFAVSRKTKILTAVAVILLVFGLTAMVRFPQIFYANCGRFESNEVVRTWYNPVNQKPIHTSNSFSQLDILPRTPLPGIQGDLGRFHIDCTGVTFLAYSGHEKQYAGLTDDVIAFPLLFAKPSRIAIIGSGAGVDVVRSTLMGSANIDAYEINPLTIDWVRRLDPKNIYTDLRVHLTVGEGRGNLSKSKNSYDMVYIPGTKRFGDIGVAPYAFVSNYLYTEEAVGTYMNKLKPEGILAIADPALFVERYAQAVLLYFKSHNINVRDHVVFVTGDDQLVQNRTVILVKKNSFSPEEIKRLQTLARQKDFTFSQLDAGAAVSDSITDDRPFFWNFSGISKTKLIRESIDSELQKKQYEKFFTLDQLWYFMALLLLILAATIVLPFFFIRRKKIKISKLAPFLVFFSSIGIGYLMIQLFAVEKITFFLGSPVYALSISLASFLLWGGLGSIVAQKVSLSKTTGVLKIILSCFILLCLAFIWFIYQALPTLNGLEISVKIAVAVGLLAIPAGVSGIIFPLGLREVSRINQIVVPWMWGVDGVASVVGSVMFVLVAFALGFFYSALVAIVFYTLALFSLLMYLKSGRN